MTALQVYRDDGPLARWAERRLGTPADEHPLAWIVPPLLRAVEYGCVITLTAFADRDAMPACFAFLGVLAFHHYDTVYRLRQQHIAPPAWVQAVGGGWEVRILLVCALAIAGVLELGLLAATVALALIYVTESTRSWVVYGRDEHPRAPEDEQEIENAE
jgi:hypothetical protein